MSGTDLKADLTRIASEYPSSEQLLANLENYKDSILLLRAKGASYEKITRLLGKHKIKASDSTVRKFCLKYQVETQQLRSQVQADARAVESTELPVSENRQTKTNIPVPKTTFNAFSGFFKGIKERIYHE